MPYLEALSTCPATSLPAGLTSESQISESQISFAVSVIDPTSGWTAYCFEDSHNNPSFKDHHKSADHKYYYPDPLANFKLDSTRREEPRQYFLHVFQIHIKKVYLQWQNLVEVLEFVARR